MNVLRFGPGGKLREAILDEEPSSAADRNKSDNEGWKETIRFANKFSDFFNRRDVPEYRQLKDDIKKMKRDHQERLSPKLRLKFTSASSSKRGPQKLKLFSTELQRTEANAPTKSVKLRLHPSNVDAKSDEMATRGMKRKASAVDENQGEVEAATGGVAELDIAATPEANHEALPTRESPRRRRIMKSNATTPAESHTEAQVPQKIMLKLNFGHTTPLIDGTNPAPAASKPKIFLRLRMTDARDSTLAKTSEADEDDEEDAVQSNKVET